MAVSRTTLIGLFAGLLVLGSLAASLAAGEGTNALRVQVEGELVSLTARNVELQDVVHEIAVQNDLQLVQHLVLDRLISVDIERQALPQILEQILDDESYQLYRAVASKDDRGANRPIPGILWIFSRGSALAPAAMLYFEAVLLDGNVAEKREAIRELRRLGTPEAVQTLSVALSDNDARIRDAAMEALAAIGGDEALAAIASASSNDDPRVRGNAAYALAMAGGYSAAEYLMLALHDENPLVRAAAVDSLGDIGDERSIGVLQQALHDPDPDVRERALEVINEINDDAAFRVLFPPE